MLDLDCVRLSLPRQEEQVLRQRQLDRDLPELGRRRMHHRGAIAREERRGLMLRAQGHARGIWRRVLPRDEEVRLSGYVGVEDIEVMAIQDDSIREIAR